MIAAKLLVSGISIHRSSPAIQVKHILRPVRMVTSYTGAILVKFQGERNRGTSR